ncbi:FAD/NAD(P)-binding domain-containing protein [Lentinus tigrinus ALCF2SS1-7]|uniref:FAD/NAD(P)-binding domain-containing protein n=1 Tax=Lentinus tigrinus ALCF2SS1-6 TaxID=1328759 RepID=A0A5C2S187_9APHY|nr:FAD/NAD(P)-binding domain-containing protein [Lentinus tigrinus ALCF2SS1-6]RPD73102.1 FAD/NAD(P)-binding domain-containing protein [Lentinus tigrinus ALCF2SS1-7]
MSTTSSTPRIAIIGGGMGGLVLLLTLLRRGIPATVYERDANMNERAHIGSTLDLEWDTGRRALRENGLEEAYLENSRVEGQEVRIGGKDGIPLLHRTPKESDDPKKAKPEIDRSLLRKIMLDALPADVVKWGHALTSADPLDNGQHELTFANGFKTVCDFLVGADGARSRIRPLVSPATPEYVGVNSVEISLAPDVASSPELAEVVQGAGKGSMFAMQDAKMLGTQVSSSGRIRTYVYLHEPAEWTIPSDPAEVRKVLLEKFEGWAPWILKLIEYCDEAAIYQRPLYMLPAGHKWEHVPGVTLIGDAAHLMTPFAAAGANLAMQDAFELGLALAKLSADAKLGARSDALEAAVKEFEENMCARAGRIAEMSTVNLHACVNQSAPQSAIERFMAIVKSGKGEDL